MFDIEERLLHLEQSNDILQMQNRILIVALREMTTAIEECGIDDIRERLAQRLEDAAADFEYEGGEITLFVETAGQLF